MDVGRWPLQTDEAALVSLISEAIRARGSITFADFMEHALYHPEHGYYSSGRAALGRAGDYFTSVSVGPLFGRLLAGQFAEMWEALGRREDFVIVEQGAQGGEFAHDVLSAARREHHDLFARLRYRIVEPFSVLQERQATALAEFSNKIEWSRSLNETPAFHGVHFSNELIDALPVHLVRWDGAEWNERHVAESDGEFHFVHRAVSDATLLERLCTIPQPLPAGYETEVNLAALDWIEMVAGRLTTGFVLVADYGWPRAEFYAPHRTTGTLRCYAKHRVLPSPFVEIGNADITAHVEWTSLEEHAQKCGLTLAGFTDQHHFLTGLLAGNQGEDFLASADAKIKRALQTLIHPQHLGMKFQFLCLTKGGEPANLAGFRFAQNMRSPAKSARSPSPETPPGWPRR
ncbi:MAG: SAM-dependent methyltransferase [Chthoniobacterales bacterium]